MSDTIGGLAKREFVLRRAGEDTPRLFTSRWAMSYLRPLATRSPRSPSHKNRRRWSPDRSPPAADETVVMPRSRPACPCAGSTAAPWAAQVNAVTGGGRLMLPIAARVRLRYDDTKADLVADEEYRAIIHPLAATVDVNASPVDYDDRDLLTTAPSGTQCVCPKHRSRTRPSGRSSNVALSTTWSATRRWRST